MDILRGIHAPAWAVGLARGIVEAAVMAVLMYVAGWSQSPDVPSWLVPGVPVIVIVVRWLEGWADQIDPSKQREP